MRSSRLTLLLAATMAGLSTAFFNRAGPALKPVSAVRRLGALRMAGSDEVCPCVHVQQHVRVCVVIGGLD